MTDPVGKPLSPEQIQWIKEEIFKRNQHRGVPGDEDSLMLEATNKEVVRALNQLDGETAGTSKDDFEVLVNVIHRSMMKSLLKKNQEKWRTEEIQKVGEVIDYFEKKVALTPQDEFTLKMNELYVKMILDLKLGSKELGNNKKKFFEALQLIKKKAGEQCSRP